MMSASECRRRLLGALFMMGGVALDEDLPAGRVRGWSERFRRSQPRESQVGPCPGEKGHAAVSGNPDQDRNLALVGLDRKGVAALQKEDGGAVMSLIDFRLGRWEDVLADVGEVDAVITDPPYGARTHAKQRHGRRDARYDRSDGWVTTNGIAYQGWGDGEARGFVRAWAPRCAGWFCVMTSHDLAPSFSSELEAHGRYVFAPVPVVRIGGRIRLAGDGPSSWSVWLIVSRPRSAPYSKWGTLPGAYVARGAVEKGLVAGAKDRDEMRRIIRDYTKPGDLVCDPCAGGATTLIAAAMEGRRAIGCEMDPDTYKKAKARIDKGHTPDLFSGVAS